MNIFYRSGHQFVINDTILPIKSKTTAVKNGLYAAVYQEFLGAVDNPKYSKLTPLEKMNKLNEYAENWLKNRNLL